MTCRPTVTSQATWPKHWHTAARTILHNFDLINYRGTDLVKELGWQTVEERYKYLMSIFMYKCMSHSVPDYIRDLFTTCEEYNPYSLRNCNSNKFVPPSYNMNFFKRSLQYSGVNVWNDLSEDLRTSTTLNTFKNKYKSSLCTASKCT